MSRYASSSSQIVLVTTSSANLWVFFRDQARYLREQGFDVSAVCAPGPEVAAFERHSGCEVYTIPISRAIAPLADLRSLLRFVRLLKKLKPQLVHTHTPKAGLLGMMAAQALRVPVRIHTFHGMRSETLTGLRGRVVERMERWTAGLSTSALAVSASLKRAVVARRICPAERLDVIGYGGCAGVDMALFSRERYLPRKDSYAVRYETAGDHPVVTCIGRIARDKGIEVLAAAWKCVHAELPSARLLVAGPLDGTDPVQQSTLLDLMQDPSVTLQCGFTEEIPRLLASTSVFVCPSFREGLGVAALEASAMQVPVVVSRVTGLVDAALEDKTGLFVAPNDSTALAAAILQLLQDPERAKTMGLAGRDFVQQHFDRSQVFAALAGRYRMELASVPVNANAKEHAASGFAAKRIFDLFAASLLLILSAPILLASMLAVRLRMGSPIFFRQARAGRNAQPFEVIKLRTMRAGRANGRPGFGDCERLTGLGRFLRSASIDELPQLWNVLKGEMSLVGPRPLLTCYVPRYSASEARRHEVLPGITGWAQVNGRNAISWSEKFALDTWYVDHQSFGLDLQILCRTFLKLFKPAGVSASASATMPEFLGSSSAASSANLDAA